MTRTEISVYGADFGKVKKIRLIADTPESWYCERIWLKTSDGFREFPVGQKIGWPANPEVTVIPTTAALGLGGALLAVALPDGSIALLRLGRRRHRRSSVKDAASAFL